MKKTLEFENQSVEVDASMGWLYVYRNEFGHDILPDLLPLLETALEGIADLYDSESDNLLDNLTDEMVEKAIVTLSGLEIVTVINITWAMAKNAVKGTETPQEWVNKFDVFPMDTVLVEITKLILQSCVSSKNSKRLLEKIEQIRSTSQS